MQSLIFRLRQWPQLVQFALVGGAAAATHLAVVALLVQAGALPPLAANVLAFLLAFIVSYNGHALLTFSETKARGWAVLGKYFAVACLSFVVNELLYWWLLNSLHWNYLISLFLVLVVVAVATFVLSKFWAFSNKSANKDMSKDADQRPAA